MNNQIVFILYKPAVPGNIGASARAIKTMGFSKLRLIDPADHLGDEARMLAHASHDILENAEVFSSFEEATADIDFLFATTAKNRSAKEDYLDSNELASFIQAKKEVIGKVGVIFGTEESGLPNEIISAANVGLSIPMAGPYPSLNLSQSVMVIAYELSRLASFDAETSGSPKENPQETMSVEGWKQLDSRVKSVLEKAGIKPENPVYNRILERVSFLETGDAKLLHSVTSRLLKS